MLHDIELPGKVWLYDNNNNNNNSRNATNTPVDDTATNSLLFRNGAGTRSITFLGLSVRVYVASMYTATPYTTAAAVMACRLPKRMDFTFLRTVSQDKAREAWQRQMEATIVESRKYETYEQDKEQFIGMFGAIQKGGTLRVQMVGDDSEVYDQGQYKGKIQGQNFQTAFLSMWFGEEPVAHDLKDGLLLGHVGVGVSGGVEDDSAGTREQEVTVTATALAA